MREQSAWSRRSQTRGLEGRCYRASVRNGEFGGIPLSRVSPACRPLVLVDGMNNLCPEIPGNFIARVDTPIKPFDGGIYGARAMLLNEGAGRFFYCRGRHLRFQTDVFIGTSACQAGCT